MGMNRLQLRYVTIFSCVSGPALLDHGPFPLLRRVEYFILRSAHLRALKRASDLEAQLPAQRMRHESTRGFELLAALRLVPPECVAEVLGFAVPVGTLTDFEGHARKDTADWIGRV